MTLHAYRKVGGVAVPAPIGATPAAVVDALGQMDTEQRGQAGVPMVASGAAADGVTDDTAAINSALQQIRAGGGGTLSLARGVTCFSGLIDVPDGVQLVGHGSGKSGPASVLRSVRRWQSRRDIGGVRY